MRRNKQGSGILLPLLLAAATCTLLAVRTRELVETNGYAVFFPGYVTPALETPLGTIPQITIPRITWPWKASLPEAVLMEPDETDDTLSDQQPTALTLPLETLPQVEPPAAPAETEAMTALLETTGGRSAALREFLRKEVWAGARTISFDAEDFGSIPEEEIRSVMSTMFYMPDMFALTGFDDWQMRWDGSRTRHSFSVVYHEDIYAVYDSAKELVSQEMTEISGQVQAGWTDLQKVLFLHDYAVTHFSYDQTFRNYDLYSLLRDGTGVCQAYTLLMTALLERAGVECSYVTSASLNHRWNIVKLDGQWYHMDVTWDDAVPDAAGCAGHDWFLLSSDALRTENEGKHFLMDDWQYGRDVQCDSEAYDRALWRDAVSPFVPVSGYWCYCDTRSLRCWDGFSSDSTELAAFADLFRRLYPRYIWDNGQEYAPRSGLFLHDGALYFNTWFNVLRYHPQNGSLERVLERFPDGGLTGCAPGNDDILWQCGGELFHDPYPY